MVLVWTLGQGPTSFRVGRARWTISGGNWHGPQKVHDHSRYCPYTHIPHPPKRHCSWDVCAPYRLPTTRWRRSRDRGEDRYPPEGRCAFGVGGSKGVCGSISVAEEGSSRSDGVSARGVLGLMVRVLQSGPRWVGVRGVASRTQSAERDVGFGFNAPHGPARQAYPRAMLLE